jgi:hypothetical protein
MVFRDRRQRGRVDLEAIETAIRSAMHQAGAAALTHLLQFDPPGPDQRTLACSCGQAAQYKELRTKTVLTVLGPVQVRRPYYACSHCSHGQCPIDVELDIVDRESSPGVRRREAVVGSDRAFGQGCEPLKVLAGLEVTAKAIERTAEAIGTDIARREQEEIARAKQLVLPIVTKQSIPKLYVQMDGTGVPVVAAETEGRAGKREGQKAHTRECKLGCVFTQTTVDNQSRPIRNPDSTTYTGSIESAEEFGFRLYTEAWRRGWEYAKLKIVRGDGALWIWNLADRHFPGAIQIVDLYHARQHLWEVAVLLFPNDPAQQKRWMIPTQKLLDNSNIERLGKRLRGTRADSHEVAKGSSSKRNTSNTMPSACVTRSFANRGSLSVLGSLRRAVKPSSLHVSNVPGCSGPFVAQTPSLPCVVAHSTAASKNTGSRRPLLPDYTFMSRTPFADPRSFAVTEEEHSKDIRISN